MTALFTSRWYLILMASAFLVVVTLGIRQSFGLFLLPATEAMGTGREVFSLAMAMQNLVWGLVSPLAGAMADKFGAARVAAIGAICYAAGLLLMGIIVSPGGLLFGQIMIGIGLGSAGISIALGAVARATAPEKRSLALGMVTSIGSFGQFAVLPITQFFIDGFGWQIALMLLSGVAASMLAACLVLHLQDNEKAPQTADLAKLSAKDALGTALNSRDYILLTTGFFVCGIQIVFIGTHLPTYLRDAGLSSEVASWSLAVVGLFNIIGSFAAGSMADAAGQDASILNIFEARNSMLSLVSSSRAAAATAGTPQICATVAWLRVAGIAITCSQAAIRTFPRHC